MAFNQSKDFLVKLYSELIQGPGFKNLISVLKSPLGILGTLFVVISLILPFIEGTARFTNLLWYIFFYLTIAQSFNIIGGYGGEIDFGHVLFVGLGVYAVGIVYENLVFIGFLLDVNFQIFGFQPAVYLWMLICIAIAGITSAIAAILIGIPTLRLRGAYFAVSLLAFNSVLRSLFEYPNDLTHGGEGINIGQLINKIPNLEIIVFILMILVSMAAFLITHYISYTRLGLSLRAIRDNQEGAAAAGINVLKTKVIAFSISGFVAGIAGAIYMFQFYNRTPAEAFNSQLTEEMIIIALLGGMGSVFGPILGSLIIVPLKFEGPTIFGGQIELFNFVINFDVLFLVFYGIIFIFAVLFLPKGIIGFLQDRGIIKRESLVEVQE